MIQPTFVVLPDQQSLACSAADAFADTAAVAITARGTFAVALSGGSTPKIVFQILASAAFALRVDWTKVEAYFVDERCVPPAHPDSNYGMAKANLFDKVPILPANIHRMRGEIDPTEAAIEYGRLLKARFGDGGVDQMWLGMGEDGHTASLFPHTPALNETHHRCVAQRVEHSTTGDSWRITVTAPFINRSAETVVLLAGSDKAAKLAEVLNGPRHPDRLPIQMIAPTSGKIIWMLDKPAASQL